MFDVALNWHRCPDGVEAHDYGLRQPDFSKPPAGLLQAISGIDLNSREGAYFRTRSDRRAPVLIESINLGLAKVLKFINASGEAGLASFFSTWGMLGSNDHEEISKAIETQRDVAEFLTLSMNTAPGEKAKTINDHFLNGMKLRPEFDYSGKGQTGRVVLYAETLFEFMAAEMAVAVMSDVVLTRCKNCGEAFFVGKAAGRRPDMKTCSDRCRVALMRKGKDPTASA